MSSDECACEGGNGEWWVFFVYLSTLAPWGIMQVYDAIDSTRKSVHEVRSRLIISTVLILASTTLAMWYVVWAALENEVTESATMLVGVGLNSWHWVRVCRGWYSYCLLMDLRPAWEKIFKEMTSVGRIGKRKRNSESNDAFGGGAALLQGMVIGPANGSKSGITVSSVPQRRRSSSSTSIMTDAVRIAIPSQLDAHADPIHGWHLRLEDMEVNDSVIDNDSRGGDRSLFGANYVPVRGIILWRMVWLQGVERPAPTPGDQELNERKLASWFLPGLPPDHGQKQLPREEALDDLIRKKLVEIGRKSENDVKNMHVHGLRDALAGFDRELRNELERRADDIAAEERRRLASQHLDTGSDDKDRSAIEERKISLKKYGPGQQDHGDEMIPSSPQSEVQHVWEMMTWITSQAPKPMENIWYESKELTVKLRDVSSLNTSRGDFWPLFPRIESWFRIAGDIAAQRDAPLLLSVLEFKRYALRIASTSALMAYHPFEYSALVKSVYDLGVMARWTHGWSGRLSCYSSLWTPGNVGMSLLGGLAFLAIRKDVVSDDTVQCLLVGIASETIMARYMSDKIRAARTEELAKRYSLNQGKTCRGSGVKCVRLACEKLGLQRSASQLDGVVAFAVGWAKEAVDGLPGNQKPRDGNDHNQIEDIFCSSRAYRFTEEMF